MVEDKLNLILESIQSSYENELLDLEALQVIIKLCDDLIIKEKMKSLSFIQYQNFYNNNNLVRNYEFYDMANFNYPRKSIPFPPDSTLPREFIGEFKKEFADRFERSSHINVDIADEIFRNNDQVVIHLAQRGQEVMLCIKKDNDYYQVNNLDKMSKIDSEWIRNFDDSSAFGGILDQYLVKRRSDKPKNTRSFEITRNVYEYLKDKSQEAIILFPAICMDDDTNNPSKESYKHRYTYMMTIGRKSDDFSDVRNHVIFDRNGLCPPGC